jgi:Flp pilus assembly protein TadG
MGVFAMSTLSLRSIWSRARDRAGLARDEEGQVAVEFAFVAFPFLLLLFAVFEVGFTFFIGVTLDNATHDAARRIRTGEVQNTGTSAAAFSALVCENVSFLVPCDDRLYTDVRVYTDFDSISDPDPVAGGDFDPDATQFDPGEQRDIVVVRSYYIWDVFLPDFGIGLTNLNGGKRLIQSSASFRNEPYKDADES